MTPNPKALYLYLTDDENEENEAVAEWLEQNDHREIIVDFGMSENHIGGDDIVFFIDEVLAAEKEGYQILTWYGEETEVLVLAYKKK